MINTISKFATITEDILSESFSPLLTQVYSTYAIIPTVILLIIALLGCFFGYKLVRFFMTVSGFFFGIIVGYAVAEYFFPGDGLARAVCVIVGGALMATLAFTIYRIGIFVMCFVLAFTAGFTLIPADGHLELILCAFLGLAVGIASIKFMRPVLILTSGLVCGVWAASLIPIVGDFLKIDFFENPSIVERGLIYIVVCGLGILVQFLTTRPKEKKNKHEKK